MSIQRRLTRRRILATAAFAGGSAAGGLAVPCLVFAQSKRAIKFTLPWVAEGSSLYTFVAKGMGFWDKHGLDVDIARGSGSVSAAQAIGEGRFDFGMTTPSIAILQSIKGLPTVGLACCAYDATMGVCVMNDGPIKTPKDLEGRTMASVVTPAITPFCRCLPKRRVSTYPRSRGSRSTTRCATGCCRKARWTRSRALPAA